MRRKTVAVAVVTIALLAAVATTLVGQKPDRDTAAPTLEQPTTSAQAAERGTAAILAAGIDAIPGFAQTCGEVAFDLGLDVYDKPERLVDAIGIETLACRNDVLVGMLAAAGDETFSDEEIENITELCARPGPGRAAAETCGMIVGTIAATNEPETALAHCAALSDAVSGYLPPQQVVCAASYLSTALDDFEPTSIPDRALTLCADQPMATRTLCVKSLGGLLLAVGDARPTRIATVDDTITKLTTLTVAVEQCRTQGDLADECQTGVVDALAVRYPMGASSSASRVKLCAVFAEPTRSYCVRRPSPPDSDFREEPGNEEIAPQD